MEKLQNEQQDYH